MSIPIAPQPLQSRIDVEKNGFIKVVGPAKISVIDGCIRVLGVDLCKGESIVVNKYRSYCLKALENSTLNILLGEGGSIEKPNTSEEVVEVWESTARNIIEKGGVVVVLGAVESGKTSFSTLLSNIALDMGIKPCIVDADVGQGDLAPPTFIGMKCLGRKVLWLREERATHLKFVGALTPSYPMAMAKIVAGVLELVSKARSLGGGIVVINTDGWFGDSASIEYKYVLVKSLMPTAVVVLGQEFCSTFKTMFNNTLINVYCLPRPRFVRERSREDRRDLRKLNYQKWFNNMTKVCLDINSIAISGICSLNGAPISSEEVADLEKALGTKILYISRYADFDVVVVPDNVVIPKEVLDSISTDRRIFVVKPANAKGLIAAITDKQLNELGMAVVDEIDFTAKRICILTDYAGDIGGLLVGKVKLDEHLSDSVRHPRCLI